ncbi:hypothetical protein [Streptomyces malaysiensis]
MDEAITETGRRLGDGQDGTKPGPGAVELFGAVRLDGVVDEAVEVARRFTPDLVVHDPVDAMGPLIATVLGVPLAEHRITGPMPEQLLRAMADRAEGEYTARGVARPAPIAVVDPYPDALLPRRNATTPPAVFHSVGNPTAQRTVDEPCPHPTDRSPRWLSAPRCRTPPRWGRWCGRSRAPVCPYSPRSNLASSTSTRACGTRSTRSASHRWRGCCPRWTSW